MADIGDFINRNVKQGGFEHLRKINKRERRKKFIRVDENHEDRDSDFAHVKY